MIRSTVSNSNLNVLTREIFDHEKGLNVHVSACRGERPVYEFTSSGKTNTYVHPGILNHFLTITF